MSEAIHERLDQINEKLSELHTKLEVHVGTEENLLRQMHQDHEDIKHILNGNGTPGIKIRIDRMEQIEKDRSFWRKAGIVTIIGLILKAAWDVLTFQHKP